MSSEKRKNFVPRGFGHQTQEVSPRSEFEKHTDALLHVWVLMTTIIVIKSSIGLFMFVLASETFMPISARFCGCNEASTDDEVSETFPITTL